MNPQIEPNRRGAFPWYSFGFGLSLALLLIFWTHEYLTYYHEHAEVVRYSQIRLDKICSDRNLVEDGHWHVECHEASHNVKMAPSTYAKKQLFLNWGLSSFIQWGNKMFPPAMLLSILICLLILKKPAEWVFNTMQYSWGKQLFPT